MVVVGVVYTQPQTIQDLVADQVVVAVPMGLLLREVQHLQPVKVMLVVVVLAPILAMLVSLVVVAAPVLQVPMVAIRCLLLVMAELEFCGLMDIIMQVAVAVETGQQPLIAEMVD